MKPSWGKTIGVFFLCWTLGFTSCALVSLIVGYSMGLFGYSTGGLSVFVVGIICAAIYRSRGKVAGVAFGSIAFGVIVGLLVVFIATQILANLAASIDEPTNSGPTVASTNPAMQSTDYLDYCTTDEARAVLEGGHGDQNWDRLDPVLQRISFGCAMANENDYSRSTFHWALESNLVSNSRKAVRTQEAIYELESVATAQMCGGFDKREEAYVGSHLYGSEEEQMEKRKPLFGSYELNLGDRYYVIDGTWWVSKITYHTAADEPKPENYKGSWPEEPWAVLEIRETSEDSAKKHTNS